MSVGVQGVVIALVISLTLVVGLAFLATFLANNAAVATATGLTGMLMFFLWRGILSDPGDGS